MFFSCLLKRYGPNLQNDTKLETTSCFIAEKMALAEPLFCTEVYGKRFSGVNPTRQSRADPISIKDSRQ